MSLAAAAGLDALVERLGAALGLVLAARRSPTLALSPLNALVVNQATLLAHLTMRVEAFLRGKGDVLRDVVLTTDRRLRDRIVLNRL